MNTANTTTPRYSALPGPMGEAVAQRNRSLLRYMRLTDPIVLFVWVIFTTVPQGGAVATLARYMCMAYFAGGMVLFSRETLPAFVRGWPLLILPTLCLISTIWAPSANEAIRKGVLMGLSGVLAVYAASRMSGRQIIAVYFLGEIYGALLTLMAPNITGGDWNGPFGQKNFLAVHMFILFATGFALLLDKQCNRWLRGTAALFVVIAAFIILMTKSATTLIMTLGATGAFLAHAFVWQPAMRLRHMRTLIVLLLVMLVLLVTLILFGLIQYDAVNSVLAALGKDSTLTGRTFIWDWGHRIMNERPWTGMGADGFWRPEFGIANQITTYFFYERFVTFSFHNSYIENGVQFGYPGYYATYFIAGWGLWNCARTWMRNQTIINAAFLIIALMVIVRSNAESDLASAFGGTAILFYIAAVRKEKPINGPGGQQPGFSIKSILRGFGR